MGDDWTTYDVSYGGSNEKASPRNAQKSKKAISAQSPLGKVGTKSLTTDTKFLIYGALFLAATFVGGGITVRSATNAFHRQMISDAVAQFRIVEAGTDIYQKSIRAGVVAEAYLMAKDNENYHRWKKLSDDWMIAFDAKIKADTLRDIEATSREVMRQFNR
jgi:hypothetical protein